MRYKALKQFSNIKVGNVLPGQMFDIVNEDVAAHLLQHKLIEPVGDHAYQTKVIHRDYQKKSPQALSGSGDGQAKPLFVSPADPALATDKSITFDLAAKKEGAESSLPTQPTLTSRSAMSSTDQMEDGGGTSPKTVKPKRMKTLRKRPKRKGGRRTRKSPDS